MNYVIKRKNWFLLFVLLIFPFENIGRGWQIPVYYITDGTDLYRTKVIELCEEYVKFSKNFTYGGNHAAFRKDIKTVNGKYEINCSTFSLLVSCGIRFLDSKYKADENRTSFKNEYIDNLIEWFSDGGSDDRIIKYSRDIAKKLFEDGYGKVPDKELSNIDTGDIMFFNLDTSNDRPGIDFMGVDHSAIFGYKFGDKYIIYEVGDNKGPKRVLKTKESMGKVVMVGILPRPHLGVSELVVLAKDQERKTIEQTGNGKNNYLIAEIKLNKPLEKGKCYTLLIDASISKSAWLNATYNNTSSYTFNMTNVRDYRSADGLYKIHFTAPEDIYTHCCPLKIAKCSLK